MSGTPKIEQWILDGEREAAKYMAEPNRYRGPVDYSVMAELFSFGRVVPSIEPYHPPALNELVVKCPQRAGRFEARLVANTSARGGNGR